MTEPTIVVAVRRDNIRGSEVEVVSISGGRRRISYRATRPTDATVAEATQSAITKVNPPATDESLGLSFGRELIILSLVAL